MWRISLKAAQSGRLQSCGTFARARGLRLTFHPDQFILLSSPQAEVTRSSIDELEYQAEVAAWIGAHPEHHHDYINVRDFPLEWREMTLTIEVEAKAKEVAIARLQRDLHRQGLVLGC